MNRPARAIRTSTANVGLRVSALLGTVLALGFGCDSDDSKERDASTAVDDSGPTGDSGQSIDRDSLIGNFNVDITAPRDDAAGFGILVGRVYDGAVPRAAPVKVATESAGCRLLVPTHPSCSPSCGSGAACTDDNVCTRYPKGQDMGTVRVTGLGDALRLDPTAPSFVYQSATLPFPPCEAGAEISLRGSAFTLKGKCVAQLELTTPDPIEVKTGRAVRLEWTPPAESEMSRIEIALDISHHGGAKGEIVCDVPDVGSFEIPEPLVSELIALGVAGFPDIAVARVSKAASEELPGVELVVSSSVQRLVDLGVASCFGDDDCTAEGTHCDMDRFVCE